MADDIIYSNDFVQIIQEDNDVFIKVLKKDFSIQDFNDVLKAYPRISIVHFVALKTALSNALPSRIKIGEIKPKIELMVSSDKLTAYALINLSEQEFQKMDKKELIAEIIDLVVEASISFGVNIKEIMNNMKPLRKFEIANGKSPLPGDDAVIRMYEIKKVEPLLFQDGKVNHYELNLINKVEKGDWLGERVEPTVGTPGIDIFGGEIPAIDGRQEKLRHDPLSVDEILDNEKAMTFLYANRTGAVVFDRESIGVCDFIELTGDVCFATGNVDFDGYVDIKKSVEDNFSVRARNDIQVLGDMGIGGVDTIESKEGNIYIRGGIAGKSKAKIICSGDLYTKFASDCTIECQGTVNIGYYAMNCNITAKEVILSSGSSKIIGGVTNATIRVEVGEMGSKAGIQTRISISGFDRQGLKAEYDMMGSSIEKMKDKIDGLKKNLAKFAGGAIIVEERERYEAMQDDYNDSKKNLGLLIMQRKKHASYLHAQGEGEVKIKQCTYPGTIIKMKEDTLFIREVCGLPMTYYLDGNEIKTK